MHILHRSGRTMVFPMVFVYEGTSRIKTGTILVSETETYLNIWKASSSKWSPLDGCATISTPHVPPRPSFIEEYIKPETLCPAQKCVLVGTGDIGLIYFTLSLFFSSYFGISICFAWFFSLFHAVWYPLFLPPYAPFFLSSCLVFLLL